MWSGVRLACSFWHQVYRQGTGDQKRLDSHFHGSIIHKLSGPVIGAHKSQCVVMISFFPVFTCRIGAVSTYRFKFQLHPNPSWVETPVFHLPHQLNTTGSEFLLPKDLLGLDLQHATCCSVHNPSWFFRPKKVRAEANTTCTRMHSFPLR